MITTILTDIEGTTSSLSFVKNILFPYARQNLKTFVTEHQNDAAVQQLLEDVRLDFGKSLSVDDIINLMQSWIDEDRKVTSLKTLQGMVWEDGYKQGDFKGHVYADACDNLKKWHEQGKAMYVYSSGSVFAQKLLFAYSDYGDLTPLFSGYFDTHVGHKREVSSYFNILKKIEVPASSVLFLSDVLEELDAAVQAGMNTCWLHRGGEKDPRVTHPQASTFDEIILE